MRSRSPISRVTYSRLTSNPKLLTNRRYHKVPSPAYSRMATPQKPVGFLTQTGANQDQDTLKSPRTPQPGNHHSPNLLPQLNLMQTVNQNVFDIPDGNRLLASPSLANLNQTPLQRTQNSQNLTLNLNPQNQPQQPILNQTQSNLHQTPQNIGQLVQGQQFESNNSRNFTLDSPFQPERSLRKTKSKNRLNLTQDQPSTMRGISDTVELPINHQKAQTQRDSSYLYASRHDNSQNSLNQFTSFRNSAVGVEQAAPSADPQARQTPPKKLKNGNHLNPRLYSKFKHTQPEFKNNLKDNVKVMMGNLVQVSECLVDSHSVLNLPHYKKYTDPKKEKIEQWHEKVKKANIEYREKMASLIDDLKFAVGCGNGAEELFYDLDLISSRLKEGPSKAHRAKAMKASTHISGGLQELMKIYRESRVGTEPSTHYKASIRETYDTNHKKEADWDHSQTPNRKPDPTTKAGDSSLLKYSAKSSQYTATSRKTLADIQKDHFGNSAAEMEYQKNKIKSYFKAKEATRKSKEMNLRLKKQKQSDQLQRSQSRSRNRSGYEQLKTGVALPVSEFLGSSHHKDQKPQSQQKNLKKVKINEIFKFFVSKINKKTKKIQF